ncbi:MAG TPA: hypothetical protein VFB50_19895 [Chloroflexota bacterium]|nr:hypothetical protein [Chloroflexota bacterium]
MTIPEVRRAFLAIANSLAIKGNCNDEVRGIRVLVEEMKRRPAVRQAPVKAQPATPAMYDRIRAFAKEHPDMPNRDIGRVFGVDGGRVSEALAGFRR